MTERCLPVVFPPTDQTKKQKNAVVLHRAAAVCGPW
jgi:hypothetical protein